ncbi:alpha-ketoglutarate-dependent dioxygenase AlkB [Pseudomaricurvus sp. HS19]|nr:alpha-ketoglutarate-dependent dioxygenase AlkB [Pseudomaricurvus sp. HS19]
MPGCASLWLAPDFLEEQLQRGYCNSFVTSHPWPANHYEVFGRRFTLPRLQTWHADAGIVYRYSDNLLTTTPWTPLLLTLRQQVEQACGHPFNAVLVNHYRNGGDHVGWHSDDERELGESPVIASLSLGVAREFAFRRKDSHHRSGQVLLTGGSLVLMEPAFQHHWQHSVPVSAVSDARVNLTFRYVYPQQP